MIALDSALVILLAEGLLVMVLVGLLVFFLSRKKRAWEMVEIERFINQLNNEEALKSKLLGNILTENCGIDSETAANTLQEVNAAERVLLHRIIQLFLQRNPTLLSEIDQLIANLSDPYCKLLSDIMPSASVGKAAAESTSGGDKRVAGLERINQQLVKQLETAMKTIDEITAEYTRVFSGNQTALELENSAKKMQQIFYDVEQQIRANMENPRG